MTSPPTTPARPSILRPAFLFLERSGLRFLVTFVAHQSVLPLAAGSVLLGLLIALGAGHLLSPWWPDAPAWLVCVGAPAGLFFGICWHWDAAERADEGHARRQAPRDRREDDATYLGGGLE